MSNLKCQKPNVNVICYVECKMQNLEFSKLERKNCKQCVCGISSKEDDLASSGIWIPRCPSVWHVFHLISSSAASPDTWIPLSLQVRRFCFFISLGSNRGKPQVLTQCARNINSIISTFIVGSWSQHLYGSLLSPKAGVNVIPVERMQVGSSQGRAGSGSQNSKSISPELWKYFSKMAVFKLGKVPALP